MKYEVTKSGIGVIRINNDTYLSFGSSDNVKMVLIRYNNGQCTESKFFPVALLKLPKMATKSIGTKNLRFIRELVRDRLVDGVLPIKEVSSIGEFINRDGSN